MPFIIWGSTGMTSTAESGRFFCPRCDEDQTNYDLKAVRRWFTIYFIPIFPISGKEFYVECRGCRGTFDEEVLDYRPKTPEDVMKELQDDLRDGLSLEAAERRLEKVGVDPRRTDDMLQTLTNGETWHCIGCNKTYMKCVSECPKCSRSE
jgi:hypothetical protein